MPPRAIKRRKRRSSAVWRQPILNVPEGSTSYWPFGTDVFEELGAEPSVSQSIVSLIGSSAGTLIELLKTPAAFNAQSDAGKKIVGAAQTMLNRAGSPKLAVDQSFGPKTKMALNVAAPGFETQTWLTVLNTLDAKKGAGLRYPISGSVRGTVQAGLNKAGAPNEFLGIPTDYILYGTLGLGAWYFWKKRKGWKGKRRG